MRVAVLPVMAVMVVVAGAVGLQIGDGAVGSIDPIHFQPIPTPRDVTKDPRPQQGIGFYQAAGWAVNNAPGPADCGDCPAYLVRQSRVLAAAEPAYREARLDTHWQQAAAPSPAEPEPALGEAPTPPSRLSRYLHYPVSQDQAAIARSVAAERAATAAPSRTLPPEEPAGL